MKHQGSDNPAGVKLRTPVVTFDTNHWDNQESHDVNIIDRQQNQHNITTKLLRIFKSKKWKNNRKNNENVSDKPLAFPKVKLRKPEKNFYGDEESDLKNSNQATQKSHLKISKSLPIRKPVIVWEEIQEFQSFIPETPKTRIIVRDQDKITVSTQTDISYGVEQRPKLRRLTVSRPQLGHIRNDKQKVSLNLTKSSDDDDQCNLEVLKALCNSGSASQMTESARDADGIASTISEMISPTMMMETEVDTDTDTIEECEDNNNIYEEVLNQESFRLRNNRSKLSSTSSIYRASWWGWPSETNNLSLQTFHAPVKAENSVQKPRLCRTAKSIHGPHRVSINTGPADISNEQRAVTKTLSEKFSYLGIRQHSVFRNGK